MKPLCAIAEALAQALGVTSRFSASLIKKSASGTINKHHYVAPTGLFYYGIIGSTYMPSLRDFTAQNIHSFPFFSSFFLPIFTH